MKLKKSFQNFSKRNLIASSLILVLLCGIFFALYLYSHDETSDTVSPSDYSEYDKGVVVDVLSDNCVADEVSEGSYRGTQILLVEVTSGQYKGETLKVNNDIGPLFSSRVQEGDGVVMIISTYSDGTVTAAVYEYNRTPAVFIIIGLFILVTILVGGRTGLKSILGLALTIVVLLFVFLPLLIKGWQPVPTAFLICSLVSIACFIMLDGCTRKILCACIGTIGGMALSMVFGLVAQKLLRLNAYRTDYAEGLLQLRQTGTPVHISGLLIAGVIISALGAVMDVAMSISSAQSELKTVNPQMTAKDLWRSGMNIGRDMVGTMTNTLILAILGSGMVLILYLSSLSLTWHQLMASSYIGIELISSVSSAIGVILAVPLTNLVGAIIYAHRGKDAQ